MDLDDKMLEFHAAQNQFYGDKTSPDSLRKTLIKEECKELLDAIDSGDRKAIAKEAADVIYVVAGTTFTHGIDIETVFEEVHKSNMSKAVDGKFTFRADGKVLKGPDYRPPDLEYALGKDM